MSAPSTNFARVIELLSDQVTAPLSSAEMGELDTLMSTLSAQERSQAMAEQDRLRAAAGEALAMMMSRDKAQVLPASLRSKLLASGMAEMGNAQTATRVSPSAQSAPRPFPISSLLGWVAAAAAITFAVVIYQNRPPVTPPTPPVPSVFAQREALMKQPGTVTAAWSPGPFSAGPDTVTGEVTWNAGQQKGFMRLKGLPENDPKLAQYQLWIFDKGRIEPEHGGDLLKQYPVDGGVFDIAAAEKDPATGDYIVPIRATLPVRDVGAFAVTLEQPGGVTVTKRDKLVLLAPVKS